MANPIFNAFFQNNVFGRNDMMSRFNEFKSQFQGDPKEQVENLVRSGRMSPEQYQFFSNMAQRFQSMMRGGSNGKLF